MMIDCPRGSNQPFSHFAVSNDEVLDFLILCTFVEYISLLSFHGFYDLFHGRGG